MTTDSRAAEPAAGDVGFDGAQEPRRGRRAGWLKALLLYPVFLVLSLVILFPVGWMVYSSFKSNAQIFDNVFSLPTGLYLDNYSQVFEVAGLGNFFKSSVLVTFVSLLGLLTLSTMAAYAFAFIPFRGKSLLFLFFLIGLMVPAQALIISGYGWMTILGLLDSYWALIFTYFGWTAFGILVLRNFFESIPAEVIDSARVDGAGHWSLFWRIVLPLARPSTATVAVFFFMWIWNDFLYPLVYMQSEEKYTLQLGIMFLNGQYSPQWGLQMAGLTIATGIPLLVYYVLQKQFVRGILAGAIKG
jgi:ABC-type glycerol-3-phosphate transport system permease component